MKRVTIADAPSVLNLNDKAMWVLGFTAALEAGVAPGAPPDYVPDPAVVEEMRGVIDGVAPAAPIHPPLDHGGAYDPFDDDDE